MTATKQTSGWHLLAPCVVLLSALVLGGGCGTGTYEAVLNETTERLARENRDRKLLTEQQKAAGASAIDGGRQFESMEELQQVVIEEAQKQRTTGEGEGAATENADPADAPATPATEPEGAPADTGETPNP